MKPNFVGIVGGIIAFISLAMPWWTITQTSNLLGVTISGSVNLYLYQVSASLFDFEVGTKLWFGWIAIAFIITGGIFGIIGGIKRKSAVLFAGGAFAISSIAVFMIGLLNELPDMPFMQGSPKALFYLGTYGDSSFHFSIYFSFGFWLALVAGIMMLVASTLKRGEGKPSTLLQPPTAGARTLVSVPMRSEYKHCVACGAMLQENDVFCRRCGIRARTVYTQSTMICPRCRNHMPPDSRFCPKCGADFFPELTKT